MAAMRFLSTVALLLGYLLAVWAVLWVVKTLVLLSIATVFIVLGCAGCVLLLVGLSVLAFKLFRSIQSIDP